MRNFVSVLLAGGIAASSFCHVDSAFAQSAPVPTADVKAELEAMRLREQAALARVEALEQRLEALEAAAGLEGQVPLGDAAQGQLRARGLSAASTTAIQTTPPPDEVEAQEPDRKAPAPTDAIEVVTQARQGYFGERFNIEGGIAYSHFSNAQLNLSGFLALDAIFLGLISIDEVNANVLTADVTGRFGATDRLQFDVNVPYIYRRSNFQSGGAGGNASGLAEKTVTSSGLGDVSAGVSYRLFRETARYPDVVLNGRVKAPTGRDPFGVELVEVEGTEGNLAVPADLSTGTGVWGAAAGVSVLKTIDPMVVYGSLTYFHNFAGDFDDVDESPDDQPGRAKLGNAIQYGLGVAYALNDRSSINMSFSQRFVQRTKVRRDGEDWQKIIGSNFNVGVLNLGATFSLSERLALLFNLGVGMTDDAPDMVVSLRAPYQF